MGLYINILPLKMGDMPEENAEIGAAFGPYRDVDARFVFVLARMAVM